MVFSKGMKIAQARHFDEKKLYEDRLRKVNLKSLSAEHYTGTLDGSFRPQSRSAWLLHKILINLESFDKKDKDSIELSKIDDALIELEKQELEKLLRTQMDDNFIRDSILNDGTKIDKNSLIDQFNEEYKLLVLSIMNFEGSQEFENIKIREIARRYRELHKIDEESSYESYKNRPLK